jgi:hypothetical protein
MRCTPSFYLIMKNYQTERLEYTKKVVLLLFFITRPYIYRMNQNVALCAAVIATATAIVSTLDGHDYRCPVSETFTVKSDLWKNVRDDPSTNGWFQKHLRCGRYVYLQIVAKVQDAWEDVYPALYHNTLFGIPDRVACCLHYLTHADGYDSTALVFGISKTQARNYCRQVDFVAIIIMNMIHIIYYTR